MPYFETEDKCRLYYEVQGFHSEKPVIVFLNGTAQTSLNWKPHSRALQDTFNIVMYDARAQGQSDIGNYQLTLDLHTADLKDLLNHLAIKKTNLVGLSHGSRVAIAFAAKNPDHLNHLILCSMTAAQTNRSKLLIQSWKEILSTRGVEAMMNAFLPSVLGKEYQLQNRKIFDNMVKVLVRRNCKEALMAHIKAMAEYPPIDQPASKISSPTLVLSGDEDPLVDIKGAKKLADLCKGKHKELTGVGHTIPAEAPKRFQQEVIAFLSET